MDSDEIKKEIQIMFDKMGFGEDMEAIEIHQGTASRFEVRIRGEARMLIGEHGNNLAALEYLLKRALRKKVGEECKFTLDINDYRMKRLENLKQDVKDAAKEVRLTRKEIPLKPMSSFERRIVHLLLVEYPDITTESIGQGIERRVVIKPYP